MLSRRLFITHNIITMNWKDIFNTNYINSEIAYTNIGKYASFVIEETNYPYFSFNGNIYQVYREQGTFEQTPYTVHDIN